MKEARCVTDALLVVVLLKDCAEAELREELASEAAEQNLRG